MGSAVCEVDAAAAAPAGAGVADADADADGGVERLLSVVIYVVTSFVLGREGRKGRKGEFIGFLCAVEGKRKREALISYVAEELKVAVQWRSR